MNREFTNSFRAAATSLWLMMLVALALRLGYMWQFQNIHPRQGVSVIPFLFESGNIAHSLATGHGFSSPFRVDTGPTAWMTPLFPLLLAGIFRIFGAYTFHAWAATVLLNISSCTLACVPIYYAAKRIGGIVLAAGAASLWAIFPNAILMPVESMWDASISALLVATILWATLALAESEFDSQRLRHWCAYGLLWGFALMTNPSLGSLLPVLLGWAAYRTYRRGELRLSQPALACGIAVLCCVPWTVRNYLAFHRFIPLRSNFAFELWLGNNEQFDAQSQVVPAANPERAEIRSYIHMGETAFMQDKWAKAVGFMRAHPRLEITLFARRFVATWTGVENPIEGFRDADSPLVRLVLISNTLAVLGALCGIVALVRSRNVYAFPLAAGPIVYPLIYYVTHTALRYRHPIDPVVLLLAAIAVAALLPKRGAHAEAVSLPS